MNKHNAINAQQKRCYAAIRYAGTVAVNARAVGTLMPVLASARASSGNAVSGIKLDF